MIRTQIYLEESASNSLRTLALQTGKKQSALIREAIDLYLKKAKSKNPMDSLKKAKGIWKDRDDIIDINRLRKEWEREN